jgi:hypothetical protein
MSAVKDLDSKISTLCNTTENPDVKSGDCEFFVSGNFDVNAKFNFRLKSPWAAVCSVLGRLLG